MKVLLNIWRVLGTLLIVAWFLSFYGLIGIGAILLDEDIPNSFAYIIIVFNVWWLVYYFTKKIKNPVEYFIIG